MGSSSGSSFTVLLCTLIGLCALNQCCGVGLEANVTAQLFVNASKVSARQIPQSLFGVFFEVLFLHTNKFSYLLHFILLFKRFLKISYFWVPLIRCPLIYTYSSTCSCHSILIRPLLGCIIVNQIATHPIFIAVIKVRSYPINGLLKLLLI